ncbi:hypothetical protein JOF53_000027 [Crossiella equi]|uniref:Uncharacterized protein n=1 Tax=Crossiella equi TaxID=130796 RepID=A0ABS5A3K0_9PSEU|nr:hypothetical protein [Crossiella equi]MBP2471155.1 hypothetical protein [Crossiella equi]
MAASPVLLSLLLTAGALAPIPPTSTRHLAPEVIVCEYVPVGPGTRRYPTSQFDLDGPSIHLPGGTVVWANRQSRLNPRYHHSFAVRELSGSGGGWVDASHLEKLPTKCYPL